MTIKRVILFLVTFIIIADNVVVSCQSRDRVVNLKGKWQFNIGDDMKWALPSFDAKGWDEIYAPSAWENQGFYGYDGYAWYRKWFYCPVNLQGKSLEMQLGNIDDVDEAYLNGKLIGGTGFFPPKYKTAYDAWRNYPIPASYLNYGGNNVIAIRVFDAEQAGGIVNGELGVYVINDQPVPELDLSGQWKFMTGDRKEWKKPDFDDDSWSSIYVPSYWEVQGYQDYDGIAWYRKNFTIPDYMKNKKLVLVLGKIDDLDETYLNGVQIGSTGNIFFDPTESPLNDYYQKLRGYYIPDGVLLQNKENVIAVRVYDCYINGGIYSGPVGLMTQEKYSAYWKSHKKKKSFWEWLIKN